MKMHGRELLTHHLILTVDQNHLGLFWIWFSWSKVEHEILCFCKSPRWYQCCLRITIWVTRGPTKSLLGPNPDWLNQNLTLTRFPGVLNARYSICNVEGKSGHAYLREMSIWEANIHFFSSLPINARLSVAMAYFLPSELHPELIPQMGQVRVFPLVRVYLKMVFSEDQLD